MIKLLRAMTISVVLLVPLAANAAMWEFSGGVNIEQSIVRGDASAQVGPYFGGGFVSASFYAASLKS